MPRTTFALLAACLEAHGVKHLFGLIGDANLYMTDAWVRGGSGRYTACAHEGSAVLAALGYAQVSGEVGVATITHGPALTNIISALAEGVKGGIGIVVLCGDTAPEDREHLQNIDQRELVKATGAGFVELRSPATAAGDLARAFRMAAQERRPVVFNMRADLQWQSSEAAPLAHAAPALQAALCEDEVFDEAMGMIASARRPLILAGRGAISAAAKAALIALSARLEAPLATTLKAAGLFQGHPFDLGIMGTLARPEAVTQIMQADCIIAFGASLSRLTTDREALVRGKRVVQVLGDTRDNDRLTDHGLRLIADPALAAERMIAVLDAAEIPPSGNADNALRDRLAQERAAYDAPLPAAPTAAGTLDHEPALRQIHRALPPDRILVTDLGRFVPGVWRQIGVTDPRHLVFSCHLAGIGNGLGEAIGAARAAGDKPTVLIAGDGGFTMGGLTELASAQTAGVDLLVVVCNDGSFGAEHIQFTAKKMDPALSMTNPPPFAAVAQAMGIPAMRVTDTVELAQALDRLVPAKGLQLLEIMLDPWKVVMD